MAQGYLITVCAVMFVTVGYCQADSNGGDDTLKLAYQPGSTNNDQGEVSFTYTLWVRTNVTESYTLDIVTTKNLIFFDMMQLAAEIDPKFKFEFVVTERPVGHYVHTIAGHKEDLDDFYFWMLYRLPERPDPANPPGDELLSPVGVDHLLVEDGGHYLFWFKQYIYEIPTSTAQSPN